MLRKFGNSFFRIQHAQIRLNDISEHFYQKMHSHVAFCVIYTRLKDGVQDFSCQSSVFCLGILVRDLEKPFGMVPSEILLFKFNGTDIEIVVLPIM